MATGVSAAAYSSHFDSVWLDLSKGLGCPVGGVLAGPAPFIEKAWRWKHRLGGAMRQAGVLAAAGVYALERHVTRLADDHANARRFAERVARIPGVALDPASVETNIVIFDVSGTGRRAIDLRAALLGQGIRIGAESDGRMRAVTHHDVGEEGVLEAAQRLAAVVAA